VRVGGWGEATGGEERRTEHKQKIRHKTGNFVGSGGEGGLQKTRPQGGGRRQDKKKKQ